MTGIHITALDHIVLKVRDVDRSLEFYVGVLGLQPERVDAFRAGDVGFPSVRVDDATVIDLFPLRGPREPDTGADRNADTRDNLDHFCLVAEGADIEPIIAHLAAADVPVHRGPSRNWGARGVATSIYCRDPDGNEIEIRCY